MGKFINILFLKSDLGNDISSNDNTEKITFIEI